jgi:hypothetical protein
LSAEQSGNDVEVTSKHGNGKWTDWFGGWNVDGKVEVQVPRAFNFDIHTSGGDITVGQLTGTARGRTSGGDILVTEIKGPVEMTTSGGDVRVEQVDGETRLSTSGGDVDISRINGDLDAKTSGGYIHLTDVRRQSGGAYVQRRRHRPQHSRRFRTEDVRRRHPRHDRRQDRPRTTSGGNVSAELVGANRGISVSSSGGDLTIRGAEEHDGRARRLHQRRLGAYRAAGNYDRDERAQADRHLQRRRQPDLRAHLGRQHQSGRDQRHDGEPESARVN